MSTVDRRVYTKLLSAPSAAPLPHCAQLTPVALSLLDLDVFSKQRQIDRLALPAAKALPIYYCYCCTTVIVESPINATLGVQVRTGVRQYERCLKCEPLEYANLAVWLIARRLYVCVRLASTCQVDLASALGGQLLSHKLTHTQWPTGDKLANAFGGGGCVKAAATDIIHN